MFLILVRSLGFLIKVIIHRHQRSILILKFEMLHRIVQGQFSGVKIAPISSPTTNFIHFFHTFISSDGVKKIGFGFGAGN